MRDTQIRVFRCCPGSRGTAIGAWLVRRHRHRGSAALHGTCGECDADLGKGEQPDHKHRDAPPENTRHDEARFYLTVSVRSAGDARAGRPGRDRAKSSQRLTGKAATAAKASGSTRVAQKRNEPGAKPRACVPDCMARSLPVVLNISVSFPR